MHPGLDAKKGLEDLFYFAKEICGFKDMSVETHGPICARISARVLDGKRIGIVIPRDHFKSSLGLAMCVWMFTRKAVLENDRGYRIMVDSATLDQSTKHIMWIGRLLRSERYKELYGNFVDRRKGASVAKRQIFASGRDNTHKDPNFAANGIGAEATGGHFELVWHDDLIGEKNWHTPSLRQKAYEHFEATESFLEPTGTKFITATRWHDGDVTGHLIKKEEEAPDHEKDWEFYVRAAIEDGKALFPERWPLERLAMLKGRITAFKWACTPAHAQVLMADFNTKAICDVRPGDEVVGWTEGAGKKNAALVRSKVKSVFSKEGFVQEMVMSSGRSVFCTPDHRWYTSKHESSKHLYAPAKVGSTLRFVCEDKKVLTWDQALDWSYFGGLFDGEGSSPVRGPISITQSPERNPDVAASIESVLERLGIATYVYDRDGKSKNPNWSNCRIWAVLRPFETAINLIRYGRCAKKNRLVKFIYTKSSRKFVKQKDRVVDIKPVGWQTVYALETETGNYVSQGYASSNSQYMNDPVIKEFAIPVEATDLYRPIDIFPKRLRLKTVTVDPNFRDEQQSSGDFGCFVVGGFDPFMHWWGLDVRLGFWTASQFIDQMFDIYKVWKPDIIKIERKFTSFLMYAINDRQAQLGVRLPISLIDRDMRSKETRYACLEPLFRSKKIKFSKDIQEKTKREMEDELTRCGSSAHDDFLDALSDQFEQVNPVLGEGQSSETVPLKAKSYSEEGGESPKPAGGWMWGQAELDD